MRTPAGLTLALALSVLGSRFPVLGSGSQVPGSRFSVRFHHVHYDTPDPSAAMAGAVAKLGGTRAIVQGLGVGVKAGDVFLLFDRGEGRESPGGLDLQYRVAVEWLRSKGVSAPSVDVERYEMPATFDHLAFATSTFDEVVARLGTPSVRTDERALFELQGLRVEIVRETDLPDAFWCPMHPDVRSGAAGKCPLCAMDLVPIPPPTVGEYKLDVVVQRTARGASGLALTVREPDTNALVRDFATVHEKAFHLFIVSRDLEYFAHVHPEQTKSGAFRLAHPLPPGEYMLIADFLPKGGTAQMVQRALLVGARPRFSENDPSENRGLAPASTVVDGLRVALKAEDVVAGKDACLTFTVTDANTGEPVTDLEPLLGAPAHMLLVRADLSDAVHAHPEELATGGPTVSFHPLIPAEGDYKLWVQFQRRGRITTVPFRLTAQR
jgi:hypothetical protein